MNRGYDMKLEKYPDYLREGVNMSLGLNTKPGYVPETTYWLYVDGRPVGIGKLRHYLNDNLRIDGGHVGYFIRPSERGKGYGNLSLRELLKEAKQKLIKDVLIIPDETNVVSRKVIEANECELEEIKNGHCHVNDSIAVQYQPILTVYA